MIIIIKVDGYSLLQFFEQVVHVRILLIIIIYLPKLIVSELLPVVI